MTARSPGTRRRTAPRAFVGAALVAVLATGCSGAEAPGGTGGRSGGAPPTSAAPSSSASPGPAGRPAPATPVPTTPVPTAASLAAAPPWQAGAGEVRPEVKTAAARFVEAAGTWDTAGGGAAETLVARVASADLLAAEVDAAALADALSPLAAETATAAVSDVVYPQYGGLTEDAASVMVVTRQRVRDGADVVRRGTTLDVRLGPSPDGRWRVTGVRPADGRPSPAQGRPLVEEVLASPRIRLPEAAAADVRSGLVEDETLRVLLGVAREHVVDVSVARSGHPVEVFGTDRTSNHTRGRAVDVWRVDGRLVVDPASRDVVAAAMRAAGAAGATEVGGPYDLDGPLQAGQSGGFFSDDLHADHLHLGVTEGREPIGPTG